MTSLIIVLVLSTHSTPFTGFPLCLDSWFLFTNIILVSLLFYFGLSVIFAKHDADLVG
jgi:hypothetical protein